jgi:hypothetical protein
VHYFSSARKTVFCPGIFFCCQHTYSAYDTPGDKMENIDIRHGSPHQRLHPVWKVWAWGGRGGGGGRLGLAELGILGWLAAMRWWDPLSV